MKKTQADNSSKPMRKTRPALSLEARERQLVALAVDRAEQMLLDGTAPAQIITHYLKLGSTTQQLENEKLRRENEVLREKVEEMKSVKNTEEMYADAIKAMQRYSGRGDPDEMD